MALVLEQEQSLKDNIRDLENALARERECNTRFVLELWIV